MITTICPICGNESLWKWGSFDCRRNSDYNPGFPPIKTWLLCGRCNHLVAENIPDDIGKTLNENPDKQYEHPNPVRVTAIFSDNVARLVSIAPPIPPRNRLLDVGCGGGEFALAAMEYGYEVTAIDIREHYVENAKKLGVDARVGDVSTFEEYGFDIICAGDVLEHLAEPSDLFNMISRCLRHDGLVWLSTPNWDGAISRMLGADDPMKSVAEHLNYFSRRSLFDLIKRYGYNVLDYRISKHYFGCMEVIFR